MSVPYEQLHAVAAAHMPTLPIKDTSTWVAILLHTIEDIQDVESDNDFLWIKCHGRITLKTIRMQYWNRYPMDEVKLVYDGAFPKSKDTVKALRSLQQAKYKRLDKKFEHVIVLRAMENEAADAEIRMARSMEAKRNTKKFTGGRGGGMLLHNTADKAIVIGDSDDEDSAVYSGNESSDTNHSEVNRAQDHPVQEVTEYRGLGGYTAGSAVGSMMKSNEVYDNGQHDDYSVQGGEQHMASSPTEVADDYADEMDEDIPHSEAGSHAAYDQDEDMQYSPTVVRTNHTPEDYQLLMDSGELDPATYQLMVEDGRINASSSETKHGVAYQHATQPQQTALALYNPSQLQAQPQMPQQPVMTAFNPPQVQAQPIELFVLRQQLHPDIAHNFNFSAFYNCASPHCRRQMILKPWTRYHISTFLPLCTECTRVYLGPGMANDPIALQYLEGQVRGEYIEKERRQLSGNPQNADPDAPFNYAQQLTGPINQTVGDNINALAYIRNAVGPVVQRPDSAMHAVVPEIKQLNASNDIPISNISTPSYNSTHPSTTVPPNTPRAPTPPPAKSGLFGWFKKRLSPKSAGTAQSEETPTPLTTSTSISSSVYAPIPAAFDASTPFASVPAFSSPAPRAIDYAGAAQGGYDITPTSQDISNNNNAASVGYGYGTHINHATTSTTPSHIPGTQPISSYDNDSENFDTNIADLIDDDNPSADPSARAARSEALNLVPTEYESDGEGYEADKHEYYDKADEYELHGYGDGGEYKEELEGQEGDDDEYDDAVGAPVPEGREESDDDYEED